MCASGLGFLLAWKVKRLFLLRELSGSHFPLLPNKGRGSVNRSPQGAIRGGFAVSPQNSGRFPRCASCDGSLARARRERRASAAWDSSPALPPVPWGERSREAFNCVPGVSRSASLINSVGGCDGCEPVDHRAEGSRRATNGACPCARRTDRASFERRCGRGRRWAC
jgi:hypothetical protein